MVAQATLTRLVMVRIHVGQPYCEAMLMKMMDENHGSTERSGEGTREARSPSDAAKWHQSMSGSHSTRRPSTACSWPAAGEPQIRKHAVGNEPDIIRLKTSSTGALQSPHRISNDFCVVEPWRCAGGGIYSHTPCDLLPEQLHSC